jgi:hypothetical protein
MRAQTPINATAETSIRELSLDETEMVGGGIHFSFKKFGSGVRSAVFDGTVGGAVKGAVSGFVAGEAVDPLGGGLVGAAAGAQTGAEIGLVAGTIISAKNAFS